MAAPSKHPKRTPKIPSSPRANIFAAGLFAFSVVAYLAMKESPRRNVDDVPRWWQLITHPIERAPELRLPVVQSYLYSISSAPDSSAIWIAGTGGFLAKSTDGGHSWSAESVVVVAPTAANAAAQNAIADSPKVSVPLQGVRPRSTFRKAAFLDRRYGVVLVDSVLVATSDAGRSWRELGVGSYVRAVRDFALTGNRVFGITDSALFRLDSDGRRGADMGGIAGTRLNAVAAIDTLGAVVVGDSGIIGVFVGRFLRTRFSGTRHSLRAVAGWKRQLVAVGDSGTIVRSADGGATWTVERALTTANLGSVTIRGSTVWVAGSDGVILRSDSTRQWTVSQVSGRPQLKGIAVGADDIPRVVDVRGGVYEGTRDGGEWARIVRGTENNLYDVAFFGTAGWAVGARGRVMYSRNGGRSWIVRQRPTNADLRALYVTSITQLWAVGTEGVVLRSLDAGRTWERRPQPTRATVHAIWASNDSVIVGTGVGALISTNGGYVWRALGSPPGGVTSIWRRGNQLYLFGAAGGVMRLRNDSSASQPVVRVDDGVADIRAAAYGTNEVGYAVGGKGTIAMSPSPDSAWIPLLSPVQSRLNDFAFVSNDSGWVVGDEGVVLETLDGTTWRPMPDSAARAVGGLNGVAIALGRPVAVGNAGEVLSLDPNGAWQFARQYRRYPPVWIIPAWIVIAIVLWQLLKPVVRVEQGVENAVVNDAAIDRFSQDRLGFASVARGLSRFIRNVNTEPPLTIAITGDWGTGKSSLMQLVQTELRKWRFRPVWFNAWHHQTEEHLLAALLENIRAQAVPPLFSRYGPWFRFRLLNFRFRRYWPIAVLTALIGLMTVGYIARDPSARLVEPVLDFWRFLGQPRKWNDTDLTELLILPGLAAPLIGLWRGGRAFGVNPGALMAAASKTVSVGSLREQAGFRYNWALEFREVTRALHPRDLVILIDDLDRLQPAQVVVVLEAVNFLITSGECFVILGMDRGRVERAVGIGFKDVAEDFFTPEPTKARTKASQAAAKPTARQQYAREYLEKLINIEIPVPRASTDQLSDLLVDDEAPSVIPAVVLPWVRRGAVATALAAALIVGMVLFPTPGSRSLAPNVLIAPTLVRQQGSPVTDTNPTTARATAQIVNRAQAVRLPTEAFLGTLRGGQSGNAGLTVVIVAIVLLMGLLAIRFASIPSPIVKDSPDFTSALSVWKSLLFTIPRTPRATKRFLNRVRYYAMRQVVHEKDESRWWALRTGVLEVMAPRAAAVEREERRSAERTARMYADRNPQIPTDALVILSVIEHSNPAWLTSKELYQDPCQFLRRRRVQPALTEDLAKRASSAGESVFDLSDYRDAFARLSTELRT